ncbi:MAG: hypothetical protein UR89_C0017G0006 [Candidatus Roizmanbacteria bacterium GW2011_GWA2_35_8]|uniref:Large ribosomal subunit protein uL15 n=1 Tax=Candidatus Roizmanbacteria bacterium GW2011_GWA2_35_8 TaxID=1618479 RepID=A0A0G0DDE3_9BACT|nr:MAG: hypothetical protein UR89_C0017G0006 [Candidatus Roizmanbacteria bacterium GW2011_GWA2_35_8]
MNFLSNLPKITIKKKKRLGRGLASNKGGKSGRGTTRHQKARENIPLHFEGGQGRMVKKYPLLRGKGRNKPNSNKTLVLKLSRLNVFEDNAIVDYKSIVAKGLIHEEKNKKTLIKVLNSKDFKKKLTVQLSVSKSAKTTIKKLGGKVEIK